MQPCCHRLCHKPGDLPAQLCGTPDLGDLCRPSSPSLGAFSSDHSSAFPRQHSDSDSEPEFSSLSPSIPSAIPVTGESYCNCENQSEAPYCSSLHALHRVKDCQCGEEDECKEGGPQGPAVVLWGLKGCSPSLVAQTVPLHRSFALRGGPYLRAALLCLHLKAT